MPGAWIAMVFGPPRTYAPLPQGVLEVIYGLQWLVILFSVYAALLPVAGFWTRRAKRLLPPAKRFAVVIPAHNESMVVGCLVDSCRALDYPRELFDVYVVADNCEDQTAAVARAHGARALVRRDCTRRGKAYALDFAFRRLLSSRRAYDAFVVIDADNLVAPDFLRVMNTYLLDGHRIIQGRMDVKNPNDTWITATFGMSVWVSNRFWYLAKHNLHLSAELGGTGMCFAAEVLRDIGWGVTSLTEDLEFSMKAMLRGVRTAWAHEAVVYDEKPLTFRASWHQRIRWVQGQAQVAAQYLPALVWRAIRHGDLICLEGALQLFQPFYLVLATTLAVSGLIMDRQFLFDPILRHVYYTPVWTAIYAVQYLLPMAAMAFDRAPRRPARYLLLYPVFMYTWVPLTWFGIVSFRNREWVHTRHTRSIAYTELLQGRGG